MSVMLLLPDLQEPKWISKFNWYVHRLQLSSTKSPCYSVKKQDMQPRSGSMESTKRVHLNVILSSKLLLANNYYDVS